MKVRVLLTHLFQIAMFCYLWYHSKTLKQKTSYARLEVSLIGASDDKHSRFQGDVARTVRHMLCKHAQARAARVVSTIWKTHTAILKQFTFNEYKLNASCWFRIQRWAGLVQRLIWDQESASSSLASLTNFREWTKRPCRPLATSIGKNWRQAKVGSEAMLSWSKIAKLSVLETRNSNV